MSKPILSVEAHGHTLRVYDDGPNSKVLRAWRQGHVYEHGLLEHIYEQQYVGDAIDVGAGIGNHTLWLTKVCRLRTHWFEPAPPAYRATLANLRLNNVSQYMAYGYQAPLDDRVITLDELNFRGIALIKIDVEGMEPAVLRGALQTIERHRPDIYAEEWHQEAHDRIAAVLEPVGYRMTELFRLGTNMGKWTYAEA